MSIRNLVLWSARALVFLALAPLARAGVHIVDASGQGDFTTIQAAVDASIDGDVILVRGGNYSAFTADNKSLAIYADANADVEITGRVQIVNVPAAKTLVLSGLNVHGSSADPAPSVGLSLAHNAGALRFQKCAFTGGNGLEHLSSSTFPPAAHGAQLVDNPNVSFVGCTLRGGDGYMGGEYCGECTGGAGGHGVLAQSSAVALYDSQCFGGAGGAAGEFGGPGGSGYHALDWGGFASRSTFWGGVGGGAFDYIDAHGGNGGNGLWLESGAGFHLLSDTYQPGPGGPAFLFPGNHGLPGQSLFGGGFFDQLPGQARVFVAAPLADNGGSLSVTIFGQPGDRVFLPGSMRPFFKYKPAVSGVWLLPFPVLLPVDPMGVIPSTGTLTVQAAVLSLPAGTDAAVSFMQGFVIDDNGQHVLGSPIDALILRCASLAPDCNANGRMDTCDIFLQQSLDCDTNSIPDECQPDCNHNGVADVCDLSNHTSEDVNHNGVPDECESGGLIKYVDASAAPGGNGSQTQPFQTIAQGIAASFNGQTVLVADGTYTGPSNRDLDFGGRNITVISAHGAASCTIDCQGAGRAFLLHSGETTARIEGFTIEHGSAAGAGAIGITEAVAVVASCTIRDCTASQGGAMSIGVSNAAHVAYAPIVRDCTFVNCSVGTYGAGGALWITNGKTKVVNCLFEGNSAGNRGGAVRVEIFIPGSSVLLSHCVLRDNSAVSDGGALNIGAEVGTSCTVEDCLIAGNTADRGGAIGIPGLGQTPGDVRIADCTLVQNHATTSGGALYIDYASAPSISNCIVWSNSAPTGAAISLGTLSSSLLVRSCDVEGGMSGVFVAPGGTLQWSTGNIAANPRFVDPTGPDGNPLTVDDNNYRLAIASPCIDAGDNSLVAADIADLDGDGNTSESVPFDLDFLPRFKDIPSVPDTGSGTAPIVDIGAYERQP